MTQPTSIDDLIEEFQRDFLWINEGNSVMRDNETRVDDWLKIKLTTLVEQARGKTGEVIIASLQEHIRSDVEAKDQVERSLTAMYNLGITLAIEAVRHISSDKK